MRSSKIDEAPVDFGLVSTYVPLVSIISRALALVCAIDLARPWLASDDRVLPLALAVIVYFDAHSPLDLRRRLGPLLYTHLYLLHTLQALRALHHHQLCSPLHARLL